MSNADKNILITPNRGSTTGDPRIDFVGANSTTAGQTITLNALPINNGTLSFEGSAGQLFSITNDLTGTIFSVNDVSGIPSIEVDADGTVSLAEFSGNVLIGTATDNGTSRLQVSGTVSATGFIGALTGNATTATTLQTARTINGVSFNGSTNITLPTVNTSGNQTITGTKTFDNIDLNSALQWRVSGANQARQRADARADATNFSRLHWYGLSNTGATSNFRHAWYDGSSYINVTSAANTVTFGGNITSTGVVTGNGSGLTSINGSNISTGTVADARIATTLVRTSRNIATGSGLSGGGNLTANRTFAVDSTVIRTTGNQTIGGTKTFSSGIRGADSRTIRSPAGAYLNGAATVTGAIRIQLPTSVFNNNTMMAMKIVIYNYNTNTSRVFHVGGYNFSSSNWVNTFAVQENGEAVTDINVRFGRSTTRQFIYIGETNSTWSYPQVYVSDFYGGFTGGSNASWASGWAINSVTAFENVQSTIVARNSHTANTLRTPRTINGVSFNGSANITLPTVNTSGDQTVGGTKTFTGLVRTRVSAGAFVTAGDRSMSVMGNTTEPAVMSFHRGGAYAVQFGLDTDNHLKMGGWSATTVRHTWQNNGNYIASGEVTAFSDIKLKENIEVIADPLTKILSIRGVTFTRNDQEDKETRHMGVIAQEVEQYFPEVVHTTTEGTKTVNYGAMAGAFIEAIKELASQVSELKKIIHGNQ